MDLNKLTFGDAKLIAKMFGNQEEKPSILDDAIGCYCIVRTRNEGINAGKIIMADDTGVVIEDARRIYYHKPKYTNVSWYEGVAETGLSSDSKVSGAVSKKYIIEDYSLTVCSIIAEKSIRNYEAEKS